MMNRISLSVCLFTLVILGSITSCNKKPVEENDVAFSLSDTMMTMCKFHKATLEKVKNEIRLFGKITADNNKLAQVYPVVGGVVTSINIELGDYVHQGQILATIQSTEVAQFQKEKLDAVSGIAVAEKNLQVVKDLFSSKLNSEKDIAVAEKELENAKAELNRMNDIYKIYSLKNGSLYNVVAPISGFVIAKRINQNEQLPSDMSEPLFAIAEINEIWALANVNESDIPKIQVGYEAEVKTLAFPDQVYLGKIDKIFSAIDPETKSMKARVKIPNVDFKLKPEMNCTVAVRFDDNEMKVAVPSAAIIFDKSKYWVMIFKNKHDIETRQVSIHHQLGSTTYLDKGVAQGETVITTNSLLVYDAIND
ncbi:MAG: efflux RND transporter periplasmic adaptor subunit [Chryseolinea sp.]